MSFQLVLSAQAPCTETTRIPLNPSHYRIVAFYNQRGTCEQLIKEGKGAIK
jgi:hypothetical protein